MNEYSSLSTSRGTGKEKVVSSHCVSQAYSSLSTSRGAGNNRFRKYQSELSKLYSYLSTSRGAGNLPIAGRPRIIIGYSYLSTSRGAGNVIDSTLSFVKALNVYIPIHLARGRKRMVSRRLRLGNLSIAPYLPREGPETQGSCKSRQKPNHLYSSLSTSRGAGNRSTTGVGITGFSTTV